MPASKHARPVCWYSCRSPTRALRSRSSSLSASHAGSSPAAPGAERSTSLSRELRILAAPACCPPSAATRAAAMSSVAARRTRSRSTSMAGGGMCVSSSGLLITAAGAAAVAACPVAAILWVQLTLTRRVVSSVARALGTYTRTRKRLPSSPASMVAERPSVSMWLA
nr:unnamed protein product [Digitaria exilis]